MIVIVGARRRLRALGRGHSENGVRLSVQTSPLVSGFRSRRQRIPVSGFRSRRRSWGPSGGCRTDVPPGRSAPPAPQGQAAARAWAVDHGTTVHGTSISAEGRLLCS